MRASCVICSDLFDETKDVIAVPCGHVFHSDCLMKWLDHGNSCPECRLRIVRKSVIRLYFNIPPCHALNNSSLENEIENLKAEVNVRNAKLEACEKGKEELRLYVKEAETTAANLRQENYRYESEVNRLNSIAKSNLALEKKVGILEQRNKALFNDLEHLSNVQKIVTGTQKEVDDIIQGCTSGPEALRQLATYCSLLKRELVKIIDAKLQLKTEITSLKKELGLKSLSLKNANTQIRVLKRQISLKETPPSVTPENAKRNWTSELERDDLYEKKMDSLKMTPISIPFDEMKKRRLDVVVQNQKIKTISSSNACSSVSSIKLRTSELQMRDEHSITRIGYNGLGGHSKFISQSKDLRAVDFLRKYKKT